MDSTHLQLTVDIHIGHLRSLVEHRQHHLLPASTTSTTQSCLHLASTTPEALPTTRIAPYSSLSTISTLTSHLAYASLWASTMQQFYALGRTPRDSHSSSIRSSSATKSRFPQAHLASRMPHSPLQQRYIKSHSPRVHPHPACIVLNAPPAPSKATFRKCPLHPRCIVLLRPAASKAALHERTSHPACIVLGSSSPMPKRHFPQAHPASSMHCSQQQL